MRTYRLGCTSAAKEEGWMDALPFRARVDMMQTRSSFVCRTNAVYVPMHWAENASAGNTRVGVVPFDNADTHSPPCPRGYGCDACALIFRVLRGRPLRERPYNADAMWTRWYARTGCICIQPHRPVPSPSWPALGHGPQRPRLCRTPHRPRCLPLVRSRLSIRIPRQVYSTALSSSSSPTPALLASRGPHGPHPRPRLPQRLSVARMCPRPEEREPFKSTPTAIIAPGLRTSSAPRGASLLKRFSGEDDPVRLTCLTRLLFSFFILFQCAVLARAERFCLSRSLDSGARILVDRG
ncbi:hypothetical protein B0H16DRAFT_906674 [Mycena metata]|uniref:Uncharacterized protein n=1 Tax=Mycena metata TaxID=1033252 RepID=A0AAD7ITA2_9AGAR|nr:hypothetical protein B0H16DRAFT_906674 [Mycena metata]